MRNEPRDDDSFEPPMSSFLFPLLSQGSCKNVCHKNDFSPKCYDDIKHLEAMPAMPCLFHLNFSPSPLFFFLRNFERENIM